MAQCKCKMCGGKIDIIEGKTTAVCEYCGTEQTVISVDDEKKANLFNRANSLRLANEFDKALAAYENILIDSPNEAEAHWGICLCRYGIEYVDDPRDKKKIPTCHRTSYTSIFNDIDYQETIKNCDVVSKRVYQEEATKIDNIQKSILAISQKEDPFDIFICYKETDSDGSRTPDSVIAQQIYDELTEKGYKVFFARITLESKLGSQYEPIIFAALNSAKVLLAIGSKTEYFNAVWVKNEWSRYLDFMKADKKKYLIPCYKDMEAYDMPEEFLALQAQNMNNLGFLQDLVRGINKIFGRTEAKQSQQPSKNNKIENLIKRAFILIGDEEYEKADEILEIVLNENAENPKAYFGKYLIEEEIAGEEELEKSFDEIDLDDKNFSKAISFADDKYKEYLLSFNEKIKQNIINQEKQDEYDTALKTENTGDFIRAAEMFAGIIDFKDSKAKVEECYLAENKKNFKIASNLMNEKKYTEAIKKFEELGDFNNSKEKIEECYKLIEEEKRLNEYTMANEMAKEATSHDKYNENKFKNAIKSFEELGEYKDSPMLITKYSKGFKIMGEKLAQEKIDAEIRAEELAKQRELDAIEAKKRKKLRHDKFIFRMKIITPIAIVLIILLVLTFTLFVPMGKYSAAMNHIEAGRYQEAQEILGDINYSDAKNQISMAKAGEAFKSGNYESGIDYILGIGGTVNVKYDGNGGNVPADGVISNNNLKAYIEEESSREGYAFTSWEITDYDLDTKNYSASLSLKAVWKEIDYTIEYVLNGGETFSTLVKGYTIEEQVNIPNLEKEGYIFLGWKEENEESPRINYVINKGTIGNKKLIACFKGVEYKVSFNANGGNVEQNEISLIFGDSYSLPTPTKIGYEFVGWYMDGKLFENEGIYNVSHNINLKAEWSLKISKITYDLSDGFGKFPNKITYEETLNIANPQRIGYTFIGWTSDEIVEPTKDLVLSKVANDVHLKANWVANIYNVTFDSNGGEAIEGIKITFGTAVELPKPTYRGYEFTGWCLNDKLFTSSVWQITEDVTLVARWEITNYEIEYDLNDGINNDLNKNSYTINDKVNVLAPTREGYTFIGWKINNGEELVLNPVIEKNSVGNLLFTANWKANEYTITYDVNGGDALDSDTQRVTYDKEAKLKNPTRTGYRFVGWYVDSKLVESGLWKIAKNTTLVAKWDNNDYIITVNNEDEIKKYSVKYDKKFNLDVLTKDKFEFLGYYTEVDCGGTRYTDGTGQSLENYTLTEDLTLYPGFKYSVTFVSNGGANVEKAYYLEGVKIDQSIKTTKEGLTFGGWYTDKELTNELDYNQEGNIIVYAKWNEEASPNLLVYNSDNSIVITGCKEGYNANNLVIPSHIGGLQVTTIKSNAFNNITSVNSVVIPDTVTIIEEGAFRGANSVENFTWNNGNEKVKSPIYELPLDSDSYKVDLGEFTYNKGVIKGKSLEAISMSITSNEFMNIKFNYDYENHSSYCGFTIYINDKVELTTSRDKKGIFSHELKENDVLKIRIKGDSSYYDWSILSLSDFEISFGRKYDNVTENFASMFNCESNTNTTLVYCGGHYYYVPSNLKNINLGFYNLPKNYFEGLTMVESINVVNLTQIDDNLFKKCNNLKMINSGEVGQADLSEIDSIGDYSLYDLRNITNIKLSNNLRTIGAYAFADSILLDTINSNVTGELIVPNSVKSIGNNAFGGLNLIESVTLPFIGNDIESNKKFNSVFGNTIESVANIKKIKITKDKTIPDEAFTNLSNLEEITLINDIKVLGNNLFSGCNSLLKFNSSNLYEMILPTSCEIIGEYAFKGMGLITNVVIPNSVTEIGVGAFQGFNSLETITLPFIGENEIAEREKAVFGYIFGFTHNGIPSGNFYPGTSEEGIYQYGVISYGSYGERSTGEWIYNIPDTLKSVTVTMDTTIPFAAFYNCKMIESINIPETARTISSYAFKNCTALNKLNSDIIGEFNIPMGVTIIDDLTFENCSLAENYSMSNDITSIGKFAFAGSPLVSKFNSKNLNEFIAPTSCETIGEYAFKGMALITNAIISDSTVYIGKGALEGFNSLETITLPFIGENEMAEREKAVFGYIFGFTHNGIPSGNFYPGTSEEGIYQYGVISYGSYGERSTGEWIYNIPDTLKSVTVTMDTTIPFAAFYNCKMIENIKLVNCVESTAEYAFTNCDAIVDYSYNPTTSLAWDGSSVANKYHGGTGTEADPYQIFSAKEFIYFMNQLRNGETYESKYFVLTSNINLGNHKFNSTALTDTTSFKGTFNGNKHKVYDGKLIMKDNIYNGLFGFVDGTIKNVGFENIIAEAQLTSTQAVHIGLIVGKLNGTIENVYATGSLNCIASRTVYCGGLVGENNGAIFNTYSNIELNVNSRNLKAYAGGLVGLNDGSINGSFAYGNVSAKGYAETFTYASGLVGEVGSKSNVTNCYRYAGQVITSFDVVSASKNEIGVSAAIDVILNYCKDNWDNNMWQIKRGFLIFK